MKLTAWTLKNQHSQTIFSLKIINEIIKLQNFNKCIIDRKFPDQLKKKTLVLSLKKETIMIKPTIGRLVSYPRFQKFIRVSFITK